MSSRNRFALAPLALVPAAALLFVGCNGAGAGGTQPQVSAATSASPTKEAAPGEAAPAEPVADRVKRPVFDGARAFSLIEKQCEFGPRPVGSAPHKKTRDWLVAEMEKLADKTIAQDFTYRGMPLTNVIGIFNPEAKRQVLLCAHWDTRPVADMEIDPAKKRQPILGANDGGSGVAVLLELARNFKEQKPDVGVVIVLFDGEDYGNFERDEGVFLGSKHYARNLAGTKPEFGILLDMVGDKDLRIPREGYSEQYAPGTNAKVFRIARELGYASIFVDELGQHIQDDHLPLNRARIPTIDLIDFDYGAWHTLDDKPDQCSAKSLEVVGNVIAELVYRESAR